MAGRGKLPRSESGDGGGMGEISRGGRTRDAFCQDGGELIPQRIVDETSAGRRDLEY